MPRLPLLLAAILANLAAGAALAPPGAGEEGVAEPPAPVVLDFDFYRERVAPIAHRVCAGCHADPGERLGRHFLRPRPGRTVRDRDHERNFETISALIEPGNPAQSLYLLKPLGPDQGGVDHGGGAQIGFDSLDYGVLVDFINGAKLPVAAFRPPPTEPGRPDFRYFMANVEPVLRSVCAECHAERARGRFRPLLVAPAGQELSLEEHYENFRTVLGLLEPGRPERSRFLQKPLAEADGGLRHRGGDRIRAGDARHTAWVEFIRGVAGPPLPSEREAAAPEVGREGLVLEAEDLAHDGDVAAASDPEAGKGRLLVPGPGGGAVSATFRLPANAVYAVLLRLRGPGADVTVRLDREAPVPLAAPAAGFADVGPLSLLDGGQPLEAVRGEVWVSEGRIRMAGRHDEPAAWVSPAEVDHRAVELEFRLPPEEDGGDDALLLFDLDDGANGKVAGLVDGGRRFAMGLLEGGEIRILDSRPAPPPPPGATTRLVRVDYLEGVAIGRLDGRPVAFLHLDRHLGMGRFGALAHGLLDVERLGAFANWEVHRVRPREAPALALRAGAHVLRVELPPGGPALDRITVREIRTDERER